MNDLDFPPSYFFQVALHYCPEAASLYKDLWIYGDGQLCNTILKKHIFDIFSMSDALFLNRLEQLQDNGLLEFTDLDESYSIDLVPFHGRYDDN